MHELIVSPFMDEYLVRSISAVIMIVNTAILA